MKSLCINVSEVDFSKKISSFHIDSIKLQFIIKSMFCARTVMASSEADFQSHFNCVHVPCGRLSVGRNIR